MDIVATRADPTRGIELEFHKSGSRMLTDVVRRCGVAVIEDIAVGIGGAYIRGQRKGLRVA